MGLLVPLPFSWNEEAGLPYKGSHLHLILNIKPRIKSEMRPEISPKQQYRSTDPGQTVIPA
jgi:hypothetical protein